MKVVVAGFIQTFDLELRNKTAFEPHELFSCKMRSKAGCSDFDCSRMMKRTLFRRPLQKCYTLDLSQPAEKNEQALLCKEQWNWELRLESKLNASNSLVFMRTDLFPLIVKAPSTAPFDTLTQIAAQMGRDITVTMKQHMMKRLSAPFRSRCLNYTARGLQANFLGYHTLESCVQECQMKVEMAVCGCITFTHEFAEFANLPVCVDFAKGFEYCRDVVYHTREYRNCLDVCGPPCEEITYDVRLSSNTEYISGSPEDKNRFAVTLKFASDSVDLMEHYPMMSVIEVLAYLGGTVGTWLGCNLLTLLSDFGNWLLASIDRLSRCALGRTRRGGAAARRQHAAAAAPAAAARLLSAATAAR
ncbi:acid-sensing ion channel 5-like [Dermacentor albipictus]|uniref:acid-sensing ion channel 5-like n=1 Tax=Dermacentor albipictus TaxID=60249 RepID=UPI0038FC39A8